MGGKKKIYIQTENGDGNWKTVSTTIDTAVSVANHLKNATKIHPDKAIRAIDKNNVIENW